MKTRLHFLILTIILFSASYFDVNAQGCVAVRQMGGVNPLSISGYTLPKGEFQIGTGYRYFHSFRHFVGTEEQTHRQTTGGGHDANGKELGNAVNIYSHAIDFNASYGITDRLQVSMFIPFVHNERSQVLRQTAPTVDTFRYSVYAHGLADIRFNVSYWMFDPNKASRGNLLIGLGLKTNSGSYTVKDNAPQANGTTANVMMDQAIQPGDGGVGFSIEMQGFVKMYKGLYGFANGYYLFNPRESNGSYKSAPTVVKDEEGNVLGTLTGYNLYASPDQYFVRAGFMTTVGKAKSLTLSLGGRFEGIPAYDALGGQVAYRRPGYVIAIEPGVTYSRGRHSVSLFVPFNIVRNRIQSAADIANQDLKNSVITDESEKVHVQGDAAFADYSISVNYSYRLGKLFNKKQGNLTPQKVF
ncbi:MAG TPA: hypothetical protein PLJ60_18185 [Chryseolinea sp.]|nr:hypothetical protein [Chryseolinea sp.]HPM32268.1 hypothetical protein [Chryseolinea sp.]